MNLETTLANLVASDLDGTILRPSTYEDRRDMELTPRVQAAVNRLHYERVPLVIVTSRTARLMGSEAVRSLRLEAPAVLDGGATIYDLKEDELIEQRLLSVEQLRGSWLHSGVGVPNSTAILMVENVYLKLCLMQ